MRRLAYLAVMLVGAGLLLPAVGFAADDVPEQASTFVLPMDQLWTLLAAALVPLATYVVNHAAPWVSEPVKAAVLVIAAAVAAGIVQAITAGSVGFNDETLQFVVTGVVAALLAHKILWLPSGVSTKLGGGTNR